MAAATGGQGGGASAHAPAPRRPGFATLRTLGWWQVNRLLPPFVVLGDATKAATAAPPILRVSRRGR